MSSNESLLRVVLLVLLTLLVLPVLMMLVMLPMMGATGWSHMWGQGMWNGGGGGWVGVLLVMAVPLVLVIVLGYAVYRLLTRSEDRTDDALEELRMTYARGDLSDEEFEKRRDRLQREK